MTQLNFECQQICITYFIICHILSKWNALHRKIGHSSSWHTDPIYLLSAVLLILRRNKRILNLQIQPESEAFCLSPYQSQTCASVGSPSQIVLVIIGVFGLIPGTHIVLETKWPQGKILSGPGQEPTGLGPHTDFMAVLVLGNYTWLEWPRKSKDAVCHLQRLIHLACVCCEWSSRTCICWHSQFWQEEKNRSVYEVNSGITRQSRGYFPALNTDYRVLSTGACPAAFRIKFI